MGLEVQRHALGVHLIGKVPGSQGPAAQQQPPAHEGRGQYQQEQQDLLRDPQEDQHLRRVPEHAQGEDQPHQLHKDEGKKRRRGLAHQGDAPEQLRQPAAEAPEAAAQHFQDLPAQAEGHADQGVPPPAAQLDPQGKAHAPAGEHPRQGAGPQDQRRDQGRAGEPQLHHHFHPHEHAQGHRRRQQVEGDPGPPAGADAVRAGAVPGGAQQENVTRHRQQRRRGQDGVDPVPEGVGDVRQPVGQLILVLEGECVVQHQLRGVGVLHRLERHFSIGTLCLLRLPITPVIGDGKTPEAVVGGVSGVPELCAGPVPDRRVGDVPVGAEGLRLLQPVSPLPVRDHPGYEVVDVIIGDALKQLPFEVVLWGDVNVRVVEHQGRQGPAAEGHGHHHQQQEGRDLGGGALRQLCLPLRRRRGVRGRLHGLRHHLGDLVFDLCSDLFDVFHVRIPFSSLYPWPQTTFKYRGSAGSISIFSRRWRMWTATVFSLPKGASLHTLR